MSIKIRLRNLIINATKKEELIKMKTQNHLHFMYDEREMFGIQKEQIMTLFLSQQMVLVSISFFLNAGNKKRLFDKLPSIYKRCMVRALAI